jgi:peptidoglycan/xylan/chitin deacetylase (PgdA/CDA1 family)
MPRYLILTIVLSQLFLFGCAAPQPKWQGDALIAVDWARHIKANAELPEEYASLEGTFKEAERLLSWKKTAEADQLYWLVVLKGKTINENLNLKRGASLSVKSPVIPDIPVEPEPTPPVAMAEPEKPAEPSPQPVETSGKPQTVLYLTFDDGPSERTLPLARYLSEEGVRATFFLVGERIRGQEKIVAETRRLGHLIANHTYSHSKRRLRASPASLRSEIAEGGKLVAAVGGEKDLVRIPYGSRVISKQIQTVNDPKIQLVDWDIDSRDSAPQGVRSADYIVRTVLSELRATSRKNLVLLFHDGSGDRMTFSAIRQLIPRLKQGGYLFAPLEMSSPVAWVKRRGGAATSQAAFLRR